MPKYVIQREYLLPVYQYLVIEADAFEGILDKFLTIRPFPDAAEAAHPLRDVGLKPDAPFFAIIDDIDTGFRLLLQHVQDAQVDAGLQRAVLDRLAGLWSINIEPRGSPRSMLPAYGLCSCAYRPCVGSTSSASTAGLLLG